MTNHSMMLSDAAQETEMLFASSPSPINLTAYYVIFSSQDRRDSAVKFTTPSKEAPKASRSIDRRKNGSGARPNGASLPLPAAPASLPFSSFFIDPATDSIAKPFPGWHSLLELFEDRK